MINKGHDLAVLGNNFIVNRLVTHRSLETRLLYLAISKINPHIPLSKKWNTEFIEIQIKTDEIIARLEIKDGFGYYKALEETAKLMAKSCIKKPRENEGEPDAFLPIFTEVQYSVKNGLKCLFSPAMTYYLLDLTSTPYTNILLSDVSKLSSDYSIRMLELITIYAFQNKGKKIVMHRYEIDELLSLLQVPDSYKVRFSNIKTRVLDRAVKDINALGHYKMQYELCKKGNKVVGVLFATELPEAIYNFSKSIG